MLFVQAESNRDKFCAVVAHHHCVDPLLEQFVAVFDLLVLFVVSWHNLNELVILALVAHDFYPVALVLPRVIDQLLIGVLGLQIIDQVRVLPSGFVDHLLQILRCLRICVHGLRDLRETAGVFEEGHLHAFLRFFIL